VDLQQRLNAKGASPKLAVDGIFGPKTRAAVVQYQKANRLFPDGIVGPKTWKRLLLHFEIGPLKDPSGADAPPAPLPPPVKKPSSGSDEKERRFIEIHWVEEESYCGGPATLAGTTKNYVDGDTEQAQVLHVSDGGLVDSLVLTISGDSFTKNVNVKNWLPRKPGGHFEESREEKGVAAGKTTPKPLKMKFIPNLTLTECTIGISHFHMLVSEYECQIQGNITYVPGYMAWIIQLGNTVDPSPGWARALLPSRVLNAIWSQPGGQTGVDWGPSQPGSYSGSDWRFCKDDATSPTGKVYWDGSAWKNVPATWRDTNNVKLYGIGIWREGSRNKAQFGNDWPENIPAWGPAEQATASSTLPTWASKTKAAWSNQFDLRRKDCPSSVSSCCRYPVTATVTFTAVASRAGHTIVIGVNNGRSNAGAWSLGDNRPGLAPHEFGHHLGAPDEYPGGVGIDTSVNTDGATAGIDPTSLMGSVPASSVPPVKARHFKIISQHLTAMIQSQKGVAWTMNVIPH